MKDEFERKLQAVPKALHLLINEVGEHNQELLDRARDATKKGKVAKHTHDQLARAIWHLQTADEALRNCTVQIQRALQEQEEIKDD